MTAPAYQEKLVMNKMLLVLAILLLTLINTSCVEYDQRLEIVDLKKSQVLTLQKRPGQKNVYSMSIHCFGKLEGEAQLVLMLNGAPYKTEHMKGKVNFTWGGDWYSDSMEL